MGTYQVSTEDGDYEIEVDDGDSSMSSMEESTQPTFGEASGFVAKSLLSGVGKTADFIAGTANVMNPLRDYSKPVFSTTASDAISSLFGKPEDMGITGSVANISRAALEGSVFPMGGPIANAVTSAGGATAGELFPDSKIAPIAGALLTSAGLSGAEKVGKGLINAGKSFERSSVGATASDYVTSQKALGLIDDAETGELTTKLKQSIEEIADTEGWGLFRDPQRLAARNNAALKETGEQIGTVLDEADKLGLSPSVKFFNKDSAVTNLLKNAKAEKADIRQGLDDFLNRFTDPVDGWDGTTTGLNAWKTSIGKMGFSGTAQGTLKPAVARKLQRAIYEDLSSGVDDIVTGSGIVDDVTWKGLNRTYSNHKALEPVINPDVATEMSSSWDKVLRGLLRTSGGTLTTPTLIGGAIGAGVGGPLIGLSTGATLSALSSPTGQGVAGNVLKGAGKLTREITKGVPTSIIAGLLSNSDSSNKDAISSVFTETKQGAVKELFSTEEKKGESKMPSTKSEIKEVEAEIDADPYWSTKYEIESSRNPNAKNPTSSASGAFQLLKSTAQKLGVKDPFNIRENYNGAKALDADNARIIKAKTGVDITSDPKLRYSAHYLGAPVLIKVLQEKSLTKSELKQVEELKTKIFPKFERVYNSKLEDIGLA